MLEPWNNKEIFPPPINTFLSTNKIDISIMKTTMNNIVQMLLKQSPLHQESAIMSRLLYKFDKKFRNDIGYRNFKKVNTALKKYLTLNLIKDVETFVSVLPTEEDLPYLPTRQMLEYVLVRIMTFAKLMLRIVVCSKQAAIFYLNRIKRGESHWMCLVPYALLSRIWSMTQVLLQHSCNWYNQLHPTLNLLQVKGLNFLPSGYELAEDLEVWCDLKNLDNFGRFEWSSKIKIDIDPNTVEDDEGSLGENILDYVNNLNEEEEILEEHDRVKSNLPAKSEYSLSNAIDDDIGVAISRNSLKLSDRSQYKTKLYEKKDDLKSTNLSDNKQLLRHCDLKKSNTNNYIHSIERIISNKDLKQFIDTEETFRNESRDKALTGHLSFMQWHTLKSCLLTFLNSDILPRKFHRRILKIWNDKCLYYK